MKNLSAVVLIAVLFGCREKEPDRIQTMDYNAYPSTIQDTTRTNYDVINDDTVWFGRVLSDSNTDIIYFKPPGYIVSGRLPTLSVDKDSGIVWRQETENFYPKLIGMHIIDSQDVIREEHLEMSKDNNPVRIWSLDINRRTGDTTVFLRNFTGDVVYVFEIPKRMDYRRIETGNEDYYPWQHPDGSFEKNYRIPREHDYENAGFWGGCDTCLFETRPVPSSFSTGPDKYDSMFARIKILLKTMPQRTKDSLMKRAMHNEKEWDNFYRYESPYKIIADTIKIKKQ